jgi:RNA polymerase sigma-70 factor (ECF subfamily)
MEPTTAAQPLAHAIVQQNGTTVEELLSTYSPAMYRAALHKLGIPEDAEDALQDALLSASRNLGQFKGECHISTWLVAIAINAARMHLRRGRRHRGVSLDERTYDGTSSVVPEPADHRANPEQVYRKTELHGIVSHLTAQLSPSLRNAFRLRVFEGFSIREAAQALGVTEGTAKAQFFRARARMNTLISQNLGVHEGAPRGTRRDGA